MKIDKIRLNRKGAEALLSPLETDVLKILWKRKNCRTKEIYDVLKKRRTIALTSVAVTLNRLHQKSLASRTIEKGLGGGHYIYSAKTTQKEFEELLINDTVNKIIDNFGLVAVNYFHKRFSKGRNK